MCFFLTIYKRFVFYTGFMQVYRVEGTYEQGGDTERFTGELGIDDAIAKGHIDDIDQGMVTNPDRADLRNKVVEGEVYPIEGQVYFVKREFAHALRNVDKDREEMYSPQEVHVLAETPETDLEGDYRGIWTINQPGELPLQHLGDEEQFELGWEIDPEQYETRERTAEEVIDEVYNGQLPEEPEDINTEAEITRGTTQFTMERLEDQETAREELPMDVINVALSGGVDEDRRVT